MWGGGWRKNKNMCGGDPQNFPLRPPLRILNGIALSRYCSLWLSVKQCVQHDHILNLDLSILWSWQCLETMCNDPQSNQDFRQFIVLLLKYQQVPQQLRITSTTPGLLIYIYVIYIWHIHFSPKVMRIFFLSFSTMLDDHGTSQYINISKTGKGGFSLFITPGDHSTKCRLWHLSKSLAKTSIFAPNLGHILCKNDCLGYHLDKWLPSHTGTQRSGFSGFY